MLCILAKHFLGKVLLLPDRKAQLEKGSFCSGVILMQGCVLPCLLKWDLAVIAAVAASKNSTSQTNLLA